MQSLEHGARERHEITIGGSRDGRCSRTGLNIVQTPGAYRARRHHPVMMTRTMAPSVYDIAKVECTTKSVVTNRPVAAYRGAGRPEAVAAIERAMDLFALRPGSIRSRSGGRTSCRSSRATHEPMGAVLRRRRLEGALDAVLERAGYAELQPEQHGDVFA